ncbi:MAG: UDP-3-O-(3-hydroxymyristoyl)glucosamine N-acyltransferase [Maricaulis sp.]|nr:UDP-3-O-(3-hydroxymyristoyl)glucosamine N-acyltransferase [Maricaulis sp.]
MADLRFYDRLGPLSLNQIAALTSAAISDSGRGATEVLGVSSLETAQIGTLAYVDSAKMLKQVAPISLEGVVVITRPELSAELRALGAITLDHNSPRAAMSLAINALFKLRRFEPGPMIDASAEIHETACLAPGVVIGGDVQIGADVYLDSGVSIGPGCHIGAGSRIGTNASLRCTDIGENCNILAGAVIGEAGFGVAISSEGLVDVPHLGGVFLGDRVTIGANTTVDRGVFGNTSIGDDSKIDNICHIAHNVQIARNLVMPGFSGVSGSSIIEENVMFGGRVGVSDHVVVGTGAKIAANSAVMTSVPAGATYSGAPAQPIQSHMREIAEIRKIVRNKRKAKKSSESSD